MALAVSHSPQHIPDSPEEDARPTLHSSMKLGPWGSKVWAYCSVPVGTGGQAQVWAGPQTSVQHQGNQAGALHHCKLNDTSRVDWVGERPKPPSCPGEAGALRKTLLWV